MRARADQGRQAASLSPPALRTSFAREDERSFSGFVVDPDALHRRFVVEILVDGHPLNVVRADSFVAELARDSLGDGCYGFSATLDEAATNDGAVVEARVANVRTRVGAPIALDVPSDMKVDTLGGGEVRWVGALRFAGWLGSAEAQIPLQAFVDGVLVCEVSSSSWRHVGTHENARPVRALDFHLPRRFADGQIHRLTLQTAREERLRDSPVAFLAFPNGLREALEACGEAAWKRPDAEFLERLWPNSTPFEAYRAWRDRLPGSVEPIGGPRIAVVVVGAGEALAAATGESLKRQFYRDGIAVWLPATDGAVRFDPARLRAELAGRAAQAEIVIFAQMDIRFYADALQRVASAFAMERDAVAVYGDVDWTAADGSLWPVALPAFDYERMLEQGYCCRLFALRRPALERSLAAGAADLYRLFNAMLDADPAARGRILHIPGALGAAPPLEAATASVALAEATAAHLRRRGVAADVAPQSGASFPAVRVRRSGHRPRTTIVIASRNRRESLRQCLSSIAPAAESLSAEVLIVDNEPATPLDAAFGPGSKASLRALSASGDYNLSRMLNLGVEAARGEVVCLLGDGARAVDEAWLEEILSRLADPDVGAAGALLRWRDGAVQHGGYVLGPGISAVDAFNDRLVGDGGYGDMLRVGRECSAVRSICLATRRKDYLAAGGFDELRFPRHFGDVDFCLKLRARGLRIVFTPHAQLEVAEPARSGAAVDGASQTEVRALRNRWGEALGADPYYSPVLALDAAPFTALSWPPRSLTPRLNKPPAVSDAPAGF